MDRVTEVPLYRADELPYEQFCALMSENRPCRISGLTEHWRASKEWVDDAQVNSRRLRDHFGESVVPVADCQRSEYGSQPKIDMTMRSYLDYWETYKRPVINEGCWATMEHGNCLYLKDWHMQLSSSKAEFYEVPQYFSSDWLNEYWFASDIQDDYRFVYIGPQGSWTPLHCDVFGSYSWSANICGEKMWLFLPPGDEVCFEDINGKLAPDITHINNNDLYPRSHESKQPIRVVQSAGEIIFVPSGWHHQVLNMKDTISINHNWFNGFNLEFVAKRLENAEIEVKKELGGFMDSDEALDTSDVETVLRAHHGMNRQDFQSILTFIAESRLKNLTSRHAMFDLGQCSKFLDDTVLNDRIRAVLSELKEGDT